MMGLDNPIHLIFLLIVLLLVFGAKRLPEMGQSLGTGLRGFKDALASQTPVAPLQSLPDEQNTRRENSAAEQHATSGLGREPTT